MYSCNPTDQQCDIEIDGCAVGNNYYLGVYGSTLAGCVITYTLTVTQTGTQGVTTKPTHKLS